MLSMPFLRKCITHRRAETAYEKEFKTCHKSGNVVVHVAECRACRPLCRWMRLVMPDRRPCNCSMYPFPHRAGSGRCRVGIPWGLPLPDEQEMLEAVPF